MKFQHLKVGVVLAASLAAGVVRAAVISGPLLPAPDLNWSVTGLSFKANSDTTLTGFIFQNQGQADEVLLTDGSGSILQSLTTPSGDSSYQASVSWALTAGQTYWLLQTTVSNDYFNGYEEGLPFDSDIAILNSGSFGHSIAETVAAGNFRRNQYWAAFNCVTTGLGGACTIGTDANHLPLVPEPSAWALMVGGFGLAGAALRRRRLIAAA